MPDLEVVTPGLLPSKLLLHPHTKPVEVGLGRGAAFVRGHVREAQESLPERGVARREPGADERLPLPGRP